MSKQPSGKDFKPSRTYDQPAQTRTGRLAQVLIRNIWEPLNYIGSNSMGDTLWITVFLSVQDAIALSVLLQLPNLIGYVIVGKDFSSLDLCLQESALAPSRYACFVIIVSDFCLWIVLSGRILARFWSDLRNLTNRN